MAWREAPGPGLIRFIAFDANERGEPRANERGRTAV